MDLYKTTAYRMSQLLTNAYSTSFGMSTRLFSATVRPHIYAIYGMVRIADEVVDSYNGPHQRQLLDDLETEVKAAIKRGYSTNPIIHSYALTAARYGIHLAHITAFFKSMRMDLTKKTYDQAEYETYIYGSAEVIGLMCLKVFVDDNATYQKLEKGAASLGAAYQKVNFLRDIKADAGDLGRWYFPFSSLEFFDEKAKLRIIQDIDNDFENAKKAVNQLPDSSRRAVQLSVTYYQALLDKIRTTPAEKLKTHRIRIHNARKLQLFVAGRLPSREA